MPKAGGAADKSGSEIKKTLTSPRSTLRYGEPGKVKAVLKETNVAVHVPTLRPEDKPRTLTYGQKEAGRRGVAAVAYQESATRTPTLKSEVQPAARKETLKKVSEAVPKPKRGEKEAQNVALLLEKIQNVIASQGTSEDISAALRNLGIEGVENGQTDTKSKRASSITESLRILKANEEHNKVEQGTKRP